jgi:hypothetical protein
LSSDDDDIDKMMSSMWKLYVHQYAIQAQYCPIRAHGISLVAQRRDFDDFDGNLRTSMVTLVVTLVVTTMVALVVDLRGTGSQACFTDVVVGSSGSRKGFSYGMGLSDPHTLVGFGRSRQMLLASDATMMMRLL